MAFIVALVFRVTRDVTFSTTYCGRRMRGGIALSFSFLSSFAGWEIIETIVSSCTKRSNLILNSVG
jgi:hypothetical protein